MKEFNVKRLVNADERITYALRPESACKRAFRSPPGYHWEECHEERAHIEVRQLGFRTHVSFFRLVENG